MDNICQPIHFPIIIAMMLKEAMNTFKKKFVHENMARTYRMKQKLRKTSVGKKYNCSAMRIVLYYDKSYIYYGCRKDIINIEV